MKYRSYVVNERDVGSIGRATETEYRTLTDLRNVVGWTPNFYFASTIKISVSNSLF